MLVGDHRWGCKYTGTQIYVALISVVSKIRLDGDDDDDDDGDW